MIAASALTGAGALVAGAAAGQTIGNPDQPAQGVINTRNNPRSVADVGPRNPTLTAEFPEAYTPPPTDIGDLPLFWASFNNAPRRIQAGGWARQVTQADFQVSEEISGVNMRLAAGGVREMHWHQAAEWGFVSYGSCRVTVMDLKGRPYVADTTAGDLWYFPAGFPHSLQGLGPDGCEFILAFDQGKQSEYNTLLVTDWMAHTPLGHTSAKLRRLAGRLQEHVHPQLVDLPGRVARAARRRSGGGAQFGRRPAQPLHLFARLVSDREAKPWRHGADR